MYKRQSQQTVIRLADVFRQINVTGNGQLSKVEVYQGLQRDFGDLGFSQTEWKSMFELIETNQDDFVNFQSFV